MIPTKLPKTLKTPQTSNPQTQKNPSQQELCILVLTRRYCTSQCSKIMRQCIDTCRTSRTKDTKPLSNKHRALEIAARPFGTSENLRPREGDRNPEVRFVSVASRAGSNKPATAGLYVSDRCRQQDTTAFTQSCSHSPASDRYPCSCEPS